MKNSTSGSYTVNFKYATGTGDSVTWATTDKGWKIIYATANDGTNPDIAEITVGGLPGGSDTQIQYNDSGLPEYPFHAYFHNPYHICRSSFLP